MQLSILSVRFLNELIVFLADIRQIFLSLIREITFYFMFVNSFRDLNIFFKDTALENIKYVWGGYYIYET